jgi:outer membrane lipoprotein-sorting protein
MKRLVMCVVCFCIAIGLALAARNYSSMQYDLVMEQPGMGSVTTKVYTKGTKSRMEMQTGGMQSINIFDGVQAYMYIPSQNMAMVVPIQQAKAQLPEIADYQKDCEYLGDETVDGKYCGVYNCAKGGQPMKMWIDKSMDFPVMTEARGMRMHYKNVSVDMPLDDSLFALPAGVKPQDLSTMMQGMQGMTATTQGDQAQ